MRRSGWIVTSGLAVALAGCAAAVPTERLQSSSAAVRAAEEVGAANVPRAALHLQLAKEGRERAQKLIADGDREQAKMVLIRAEADADLAVAIARSAQAEHEAQVAAEKLGAMDSSKTTP